MPNPHSSLLSPHSSPPTGGPNPSRSSFLFPLSSTTLPSLAHADYSWPLQARDNQIPPKELWAIWLLLAGRGFGKTRTGAEWVRTRVESGRASRIALVARTPADARDIMIQGESGLLNVCPPWFKPVFEPTKRRLTWPNGATAFLFSSYEPDQLRGPQFDTAWCDELASWEYPRETWDNLAFAVRLGDDPRFVVTTTPKPIALLRELVVRTDVIVTRGSSYDNEANLSFGFFSQVRSRYEGTRTGRQEIYAELLDQAEDALWERQWIDDARVAEAPNDIERIVVAIDPAVSSDSKSSETGIVVVGTDSRKHCYVIADGSGRMSPNAWANRAISLYRNYKADRIIGETNNGGDLVEEVLRAASSGRRLPYRAVNASRGKHARAEPVAALYEQHKVHHVGMFPELEDQMCTWTPQSSAHGSPDRMDALVWAVTELLGRTGFRVRP